MIANALRVDIDQYAATLRTQNALFVKTLQGTLAKSEIVSYLANIREIIIQAQDAMIFASKQARARNDVALAEWFAHKQVEEKGHDTWAVRDISQVRSDDSGTQLAFSSQVVPAIRELVANNLAVIDEDPALYLTYTLFTEYLTVIAGPEWLSILEERCHVPRAAMTVVGNHIELDKDHVEEALESIDRLVTDPKKLARMREVLKQHMTFFDEFCLQITSEAHVEPQRATNRPAA